MNKMRTHDGRHCDATEKTAGLYEKINPVVTLRIRIDMALVIHVASYCPVIGAFPSSSATEIVRGWLYPQVHLLGIPLFELLAPTLWEAADSHH